MNLNLPTCCKNAAYGNRHAFIGIAAIAFLGLLFLRHPAGIIDANFWAEDGWFWYRDAYTLGWQSLLLPHSGYLQSFSRVIALAVQPFPLLWAPTLFAAAALVVQVLPPLVLLSRRIDPVWPDLKTRALFCLLYIALPNSFEEFGNVTNSQWFLSVLAFLIVVSTPPRSLISRAADLIVLLVSGLSGPFCLFITPIAMLHWYRQRTVHTASRLACLAIASAVQGTLIALTRAETRTGNTLGVSFGRLARILAMQVEMGLLVGSHVMSRIASLTLWENPVTPVFIVVAGATILLIALWRGTRLFRHFALFGGLVLSAALISPVISLDEPAWVVLGHPGAGQRYFLIPMLVVAGSCFVLASDQNRRLRQIGFGLCLILFIGVAGDWPYPHMKTTDFNAMARQFSNAAVGTRMTFEIHPPGVAPMVLVKR